MFCSKLDCDLYSYSVNAWRYELHTWVDEWHDSFAESIAGSAIDA